jgi:ATP-dependent protease HslVU (ClpYQ) peptidase subunit
MSVIAIKNTKDKIVIISDNQVTYGDDKVLGNSPTKLIQITDNLIFGSAGECRVTCLLDLFCETMKPKNSDKIEIIRFFNNFEKWMKANTEDNHITISTNHFIIICDKKSFIFKNYYLKEIVEGEFDSIGSGSSKAMVAMELVEDLEKAISAVCNVDLYCHLPLIKFEVKK